MIPPCAGKWDLFDSTDPLVHLEAAAICATCPMILACHQALQEALEAALGYGLSGGPRGTWAGRLVGAEKYVGIRSTKNLQRMAAEEAMFSEADCQRAKAAYERGDRSDWVMAGRRTYERRRRRERKVSA